MSSVLTVTAFYPATNATSVIVSTEYSDLDEDWREEAMLAVYSHYVDLHASKILAFIEKDDSEEDEKLDWTYQELALESLQLFGDEESEFLAFQKDVQNFIISTGGSIENEPVYRFSWDLNKKIYKLKNPKQQVTRN